MTRRDLEVWELERLFTRGQLSRRQFALALGALGMTAGGLAGLLGVVPESAAAETGTARYLVLIVLDAFRPDYMNLAPMPALTALMRRGTSFDRAWVGQLESETPTGHASLSTGSLPNRNGIIGFEWRDPKSGHEVLDGWPKGVVAGKMERDLREAGAPSIPFAVKAADPTAKVVALSSEKVYAAMAMGGWAADFILYHQRGTKQDPTVLPRGIPGHEPLDNFFARPKLRTRLPMKHFTDWDYLSSMLALAALQEYRPRVLMVNLPGADFYGHTYGGPASPAVMRQIVAGLDRNIDRIVGAYKAAGIYDQTVFVVTADHGMVPNARSVDGSITKAAVRGAGGQYLFHTGGTAADIYLANTRGVRPVAQAMTRVPNVVGSYFQVNTNGRYEYVPVGGQKISPALDAAYRHLLGTIAGPTAPDIVAPFRENTVGSGIKVAYGDHGGLNWGAQSIPLILSGPGVKAGALSHFPARLIDVAPTALRLLGVPIGAMDGVVLADSVVTATASDVAAQLGLAPSLTSLQDSLIETSAADMAEDAKSHVVPPPSRPVSP